MEDIDPTSNNDTTLYSVNYVGLRFKPSENLEEALWSMVHPESTLRGKPDPDNPDRVIGRSALFLYSQPQRIQKQRGQSVGVSPELSSQVHRHIKGLERDTYPLARFVMARTENDRVGILFSVLPDVKLQRQLHACYPYGLNETIFGNRAIQATFWLPMSETVKSREDGLEAKINIREAIWGYDDPEANINSLQAPERGGSRVSNVEWIDDMRRTQLQIKTLS